MKFSLSTIVASAILAFASVAMAQPTPYPTQDSDWPGQGPIRKFNWMDDNRAWFWTQREKDQGKIVFVGDSLTGNWKTLAKDFPDLKVANRGIGGDVSRGLLFRFKEDVLDLNPKAVVILIGINDLTAHGKPDATLANLTAILDQAKEHNAAMPVIVCTVPETQNPKAPVREPDRLAINEGIRRLAAERDNVELCELDKALATPDGHFDATNFGQDQLHLAPAGYEKWKAAVKPILDNVLAADTPQQ